MFTKIPAIALAIPLLLGIPMFLSAGAANASTYPTSHHLAQEAIPEHLVSETGESGEGVIEPAVAATVVPDPAVVTPSASLETLRAPTRDTKVKEMRAVASHPINLPLVIGASLGYCLVVAVVISIVIRKPERIKNDL